MIDLGKQSRGLYRLQIDACPLLDDAKHFHSSLPPNDINNILANNVLWHFRPGHVSNNNLKHFTIMYPSITFDNKATCDICHLARQKKLPFPRSSFIANSKFQKMHLANSPS